MIATEQFVFVHVPKTGGVFLGEAMREHTAAEDLGQHALYGNLPERYRGLPAICFVRNPWDWYVSFWHHRRRQGFEGDLRELLSHAHRTKPDTYTRSFRRIAGDGVKDGRVEVGRFESLARTSWVSWIGTGSMRRPSGRR